MTETRTRSAAGWLALAKRLHAIRCEIADVYRDATALATHGDVHAPAARAIIVGRAIDTTNAAVQQLADLEQTVRNEAARLERRARR